MSKAQNRRARGLNSHVQMEKREPAGQHNLIRDIPISSLLVPRTSKITFVINLHSSSLALGQSAPRLNPPSPHLNNNLISHRHTVTQFPRPHLAARTRRARTGIKVLHTLEYRMLHGLMSLDVKAEEM